MTIKKLLLISRPRFWLYVFGPYIIGISTLSDLNQLLRIDILYGLFYFLLPANIFIYSVNDYFDQSIDINNPKKNNQEMYMHSKDADFYRGLIFISGLMSLPLVLSSYQIAILTMVFLLLGFFYSSPPFRFKTKVFLDSISNIFYIIPGVIGYFFVSLKFPSVDIIAASSMWVIAMHLFSAIVDIDVDKKAGIRTTATTFGYTKSLILTIILWFASVTHVVPYNKVLIIGYIYALLPLFVLMKRLGMNKAYWIFPIINAVLGFVLFCVMIYG